MKLGGLDHPKTLDFAARLDVILPQAIGHLELLWAFVAQKTPHGNVGKWPDGAVARASQWSGDPTVFVTALCEAGFIDEHPVHRYIVHDWQEHAPRWVTSKLSRAKESFCAPHDPSEERTPQSEKPDSSGESTEDNSGDYSPDDSADSKPSLAKPSLAKSSLAKSSQAKPSEGEPPPAGSAGKPRKSTLDEKFNQAWADYPKRAGGNSKRDARKAWDARVKAGADPDDILGGVQRYAAFCRITGKTGTEFVKQGATFFGPSEHYLDDWAPPPPGGAPGQARETPYERGQRMARERGIIQ